MKRRDCSKCLGANLLRISGFMAVFIRVQSVQTQIPFGNVNQTAKATLHNHYGVLAQNQRISQDLASACGGVGFEG